MDDAAVAPDAARDAAGSDAGHDVDAGTVSDGGFDAALDVDTGTGTDGGAPIDAGRDAGASGPPFPTTWDGTMPTDGVCSVEGWCWVYPEVPELGWADVSTTGSEIWALGLDWGAIVHFDGTHWTGVLHAFDQATRISAASSSSVFLLTSTNHIHHYDGTRWTEMTVPSVPPLHELWARTSTDAWAVGDLGTVLHWDGASWSVVDAGFGTLSDLRAVHGTSATDVWVGGTGGAVRHYDGTWTARNVSGDVATLFATSATDVWAGGAALSHWTGSAWGTPPGRTGVTGVVDIAGSPTGEAFVLSNMFCYLWNGSTLGYAIGLTGTSDLGSHASVAWDGQFLLAIGNVDSPTMRDWSLGHTTTGATVTSLHARPIGAISSMLVMGNDDLLVTSGATAVNRGAFDTSFASHAELLGHGVVLAAPSLTDVWTADPTAGYVQHWNGSTWGRYIVVAGTRVSAISVAGANVWAIAGSTVYRFVGGAWTADASAPTANVLVPAGGDTLFAAGFSSSGPTPISAAGRFDGSTWMALPTPPLSGQVWTGSPSGTNELTLFSWATSVFGGSGEPATLSGGTWQHGPPHGASRAVCRGVSCWAIAQDIPVVPPTTAYWDGTAFWSAPTYIDGPARAVTFEVAEDATGRTWVLYGPGHANVAVLEWRVR